MKHLAGRTATSLSALLVAALVTLPAADAGEALGTPGASGIGDSYFPKDGNGGYDVQHYDIHDTYRMRSGDLTGWTDVSARATKDLSSLSLDLVLIPTKVTVDGQPAAFRKSGGHELVVTPAAGIASGDAFVVRVIYRGTPRRIGWGGERPFFAASDEVMAINQPHIAPWWFPANDHPKDKALYDITIRVANGNAVISNGTRVSRTVSGGWTTSHWRMTEPMASYLAFFAAGRFRVQSGVSHGLPWTVAVSSWFDRRTEDQQLRLLRRTPAIVRWLSTQFGPYPFDSTGGVMTSLPTGFALENQGRPTYPFLGTGAEARSVVVHELAHQWFGDSVSVERWRDIWLNEGFATWAEWRYDETHGGRTAWRRLHREYAAHPAGRAFWRMSIANPGPSRIFNQPVYDRGAMTIQALRHRIGTTAMLTVLRRWAAENAYSGATTPEFEALAEEVSGKDLDGFFDRWLRTGKRPTRTIANGLR